MICQARYDLSPGHPAKDRDRSARAAPVAFPQEPPIFLPGEVPHIARYPKITRGGNGCAKNRRRSSRFETNHEWMKRKGPTLKRSDATNGRAIVKNSDCGPYEAEDNVQREIPLNHKVRMVGLENGLRIQQILAQHRVRRIRNEGIE